MGLTFRNVKGSALTIDELDDNFSYFTGSQSITGSLVVTGDEDVNGNLIVSGNITGTSSLAVTASHALQADNATTASYALTATTSSFALTTPIAPTQTSVTALGTDITTTVILEYTKINLISATSTDYAVRLPEPQFGGVVNVVNQSSVDISVFPYDSNDSILGQSSGAAYIVPADGQLYQITCVQNPGQGVWSVTTPSSNNNVKRSVTIDLIATGSNPLSYVNGFSMNAEESFNASAQTYYPSSGAFSILVPDAGLTYIDSPEFDQYNKVRITKFEILSNVPAGNLTGANSQISSTLMGITPSQFAYLKASTINETITGSIGGSPTTPTILWQVGFDNFYSSYYNTNGSGSVSYITHYVPTATSPAPTGSGLYQKITGVLPNGWQNGWQDLKSAHGERRVYLQANGFYGANNTGVKYTDYPAGFELKLQYNIEFEFAL